MNIYQAGPLFTHAEQAFNLKIAAALREAGHHVFLPQEHEEKAEAGYTARIFLTDLEGLDQAEAIVAILDGSDVDSGTAWECGYAYAKDKPIFGLRTDIRLYGKEESINLMVQVPCRILVNTVEDLLESLRAV